MKATLKLFAKTGGAQRVLTVGKEESYIVLKPPMPELHSVQVLLEETPAPPTVEVGTTYHSCWCGRLHNAEPAGYDCG